MAEMTSRHRMLAAINNQVPDRVPAAPDISNMVPVRLSGRGYFNVFIHEDPPLWQAYIDAVKYFHMDGWFTYGGVAATTENVTTTQAWLLDEAEEKILEITYHTSKGRLTEQFLYSVDKPPMRIKKMVSDIDRDWPRLRCLFGPIEEVDFGLNDLQKESLGEQGVYGIGVYTPGFHYWYELFEGSIQTLSYLSIDHPALLDELRELHHARLMEELEYALQAKPDLILTGGSGSITIASPKLWRKYALPTLVEICQVCAGRGVPTMLHACGKEKYILKTCAEETQLSCINPLEVPPMGDITLAEAKEMVAGTQLTLMGNLHTTDTMLLGSVDQVKAAARKAIHDAGQGGGFILSTGDQCGWSTPDENIFALVETAREYGSYSDH
jgi:uroporphyrinogen decarboxylase